MKVSLKDLYDFNLQTNLVNDGYFKIASKSGMQKIQAIDITAKNSPKLIIKTKNFNVGVSPEHLLYRKNWTKSNELKIGDSIDTINGYEEIISINHDSNLEDLYDIQVTDNEFYANGIRSHNSSLLESIDFALYNIVRGKYTKRVPSYILPNRRNKNLETIIDFVNWNNDNIIINRKLGPKGFKITINDIDRTDKYDLMQQEEKDDIIGIEYNTYKSLVSLNLADFANFINLDTDTKKKLLNKLFNIDEIDGYQSIAKELLKNEYKRKEKLETLLLNNENTINTYKRNIQNILEQSGADINKQDIKEKMLEYKSKFIPLKNEIKDLRDIVHTLSPEIKTKIDILNAKKSKMYEEELILNEANNKIEIYQKGICPFCDSVLTDKGHKHKLNDLEENYNELKDAMLELKKSFNNLKDEVSGKVTEKRNILNEINKKEIELDTIKEDMTDLREKYDRNTESISINELNKNIEQLENDNVKYNKSMEKLLNKISKYEKLVDVLSEKGIRKGIINTVVDPINEHLGKYLIDLESSYNVRLDDSFDAIIKERYIDDIHVESLSMGEAKKINVAIALSYMEMVLSMNKKTNILFMDEVFASVDDENVDLILKALRSFSINNKINVIIATPLNFDTAHFDRILTVKKENGYTFITEN